MPGEDGAGGDGCLEAASPRARSDASPTAGSSDAGDDFGLGSESEEELRQEPPKTPKPPQEGRPSVLSRLQARARVSVATAPADGDGQPRPADGDGQPRSASRKRRSRKSSRSRGLSKVGGTSGAGGRGVDGEFSASASEWTARLLSGEELREQRRAACKRAALKMRTLIPEFADVSIEDHLRICDAMALETEKCQQAVAKAAYLVGRADWEELQELRSRYCEMEEKIASMNRNFLQEITASRDANRQSSKIVTNVLEVVESQKNVEFYEPLQFMSPEVRSACMGIVEEKIKAIFDHDPSVAECANTIELKHFREAHLKDKCGALSSLNSQLRDEARELRATNKKNEALIEKLQWQLSSLEVDGHKNKAAAQEHTAKVEELETRVEVLQADLQCARREATESREAVMRAERRARQTKEQLAEPERELVDAGVQADLEEEEDGEDTSSGGEGEESESEAGGEADEPEDPAPLQVIKPTAVPRERPRLLHRRTNRLPEDDAPKISMFEEGDLDVDAMVTDFSRQQCQELKKKVKELSEELKAAAEERRTAAEAAAERERALQQSLQETQAQLKATTASLERVTGMPTEEWEIVVKREEAPSSLSGGDSPTSPQGRRPGPVACTLQELQEMLQASNGKLSGEIKARKMAQRQLATTQAELKEELERRAALEAILVNDWTGDGESPLAQAAREAQARAVAKARAKVQAESSELSLRAEQIAKLREQVTVLKAQLGAVSDENQVLCEAMSKWQHEVPKVTKWLRQMGSEDKAKMLEYSIQKLEEAIEGREKTAAGRLHLDAKLREIQRRVISTSELELELEDRSPRRGKLLSPLRDEDLAQVAAGSLAPQPPDRPPADVEVPDGPRRAVSMSAVSTSFAAAGGVLPRVVAPPAQAPMSLPSVTPRGGKRDSTVKGMGPTRSTSMQPTTSRSLCPEGMGPVRSTSGLPQAASPRATPGVMQAERSGSFLVGAKGGFALFGHRTADSVAR